MVRIIHLSDFHLNQQNLADWIEYVCEALVSLINQEPSKADSTFIACTGDLLDKGGVGYSDIVSAFDTFKTQVIDSLVNKTGIPLERFIIIPGNHDIDRNADKAFENSGLRAEFKSKGISEINKYTKQLIETDDKQGSKRIVKYKEFENELYANIDSVTTSFLGTTFKYDLNGVSIGFAGLNSSWCAYGDDDYQEGLAIGEPQYNKCFKEIEACKIKVALLHHPLDWMKYEKDTVGKWLYKNFNILLIGHVHEGNTTMETKLSGTLFVNVAPSCTSDIRDGKGAFANGVSIIEYDFDGRTIDCAYYIYSHHHRSYIANTSLVEDGKYRFITPNPGSSNIQDIVDNALTYIKDNFLPHIDRHIIPQKANVIKSLKDAFVMPPIKKHGVSENEEISIDINYILKNKAHLAFFGVHESGKTILLYRLLLEFIEQYDQHNVLPIYLDFEDMGGKEIDTIVKNFTDLNSNQVASLLSSCQVVLLVDNYNPSPDNPHQTQRLYKFVNNHNVKIIAVVENDLVGTAPTSFIQSNQLAFEWYYLEHLKSTHVKELMIKWTPEDEFLQRNSKLERMVSKFSSYSLPCTAMSVSLYLWSTENADREPVNQAVLLDIYIEIILEKLNKENIYRNTFDYHNKTMLLARIAKEMSEYECYEIEYSGYIKCIESYLKDVGFTSYKADRLGDYFIAQKIFSRTDNTVKFAHSCFYHFFIAKRMINDDSFKNHILSEDVYYRYHRAIDYYTGLRRDDSEVLQLMLKRFLDFFKPAEPIYDGINIDECFTNIVKDRQPYIPVASKVNVEQVKALKPTQERVEQRLHHYCDERLSKISDDFSKFKHISPELQIIMMCNILRNSEGVENVDLKQEVYNAIVKNTLILAVTVKDVLANYANTNGGRLPIQFENIRNVEAYFRFMPFIMQYNINAELGTSKLNSVFKKKIISDRNDSSISDVEKFISIAMYWDNHGNDYDKEIKAFIKKVGRNSVQDYMLAKLLELYNNHTKKGSEEEKMYLNLISDLRIKNERLPKRLKDKIKKLIESDKK